MAGFLAKERNLVWALLRRKIRLKDRRDCCWLSGNALLTPDPLHSRDPNKGSTVHNHSRCVTPCFFPDRAGYSSADGFERNRLICERRDFSSSVRFFAARDLLIGTLLAGR